MCERYIGALVGLAVVGCFVVFWFALTVGAPRAAHSVKPSEPLPGWSSDKIRAQMGEANQVVDGSALGLPQGTTCRLWFQQARALILCTA